MKKRLSVLLALVLLLGLSACGQKGRQVHGLVTEVQISESGELTAFVVRSRDGEETGVVLTEDTTAIPGEPGVWKTSEMRTEFQKDLQPDVTVFADCLTKRKKLTAEDGREIAAYQAEYITITGRLSRGAVTLRDGTAVDVLEEGRYIAGRIYCLPDGAELLWVRGPSGPDGYYVGGLESFDDLSETAREKVLAWYEAKGALYDETEELERAYSSWKAKGEDFQCHMVEQEVTPSAASERVMYFATTVTLPLDHGDSCTSCTLNLGAAFDRETGEYLSLWDLFRCPEEEARRAIIDGALDWPESGGVRAGLEAAFTPERVIVSSDSMTMNYEPGSMPSQEHGWTFYVGLDKLRELMYPWAAPKSTD